MPSLADLKSTSPIKAIIAAQSGLGKTGLLWSLAKAGFKLRIYDCDRGSQILASLLKSDPEAMARVQVNVFTDKMRGTNTGFAKPDEKEKLAWVRLSDALNKWPDNPDESPQTWSTDTVAVFDSVTIMGKLALTYAQKMNQRSGKKPEWTDYGDAQAALQSLFALLYSDYVNCHVLYLTHVSKEHDKDGNFIGAYPSSVGKALNEVIPRYVNNILTMKMVGMGAGAKRYLCTQPTSNQIITKTEELNVAKEYLASSGTEPHPALAQFFADCGWEGPR